MNLQKLNWTRLSDRGRKEFTLVEPILGGKNKCIRVCEDGEYNEEGFDRAYREICMYDKWGHWCITTTCMASSFFLKGGAKPLRGQEWIFRSFFHRKNI